MKLRLLLTLGLLSASFAPAAFADGRHPGSVLVYTIHRSGPGLFTVISVTNTNLQPQTPNTFGGSVLAHFQYVNTIPNPADSQLPLGCYINDRTEFLTPADTLSVLTTCHNAASAEGYLVIVAEDPNEFGDPFKHNYLIGSEIVVNDQGGVFSQNAIPLEAISGNPSDDPLDLRFNGANYEGIPKTHFCDSFLAAAGSSLTLINLTGGADFLCTVRLEVWNDFERPLSATKTFRCWMEERLIDINPLFSDAYLTANVPNDPIELDINCDNVDDYQTGWFRLRGIVAFSSEVSYSYNQGISLLGSITAGPTVNVDGGRLLWEEKDNNSTTGVFLGFGSNP